MKFSMIGKANLPAEVPFLAPGLKIVQDFSPEGFSRHVVTATLGSEINPIRLYLVGIATTEDPFAGMIEGSALMSFINGDIPADFTTIKDLGASAEDSEVPFEFDLDAAGVLGQTIFYAAAASFE